MKKTVLITGASSGIGRAAALRFLEEGCEVFAGARRTDRMKDLQQKGAHIAYLDVTDEKSCETFVKTAAEKTGSVDILVNNAGYGEYGPVEAVSEEKAKKELDTVLFGTVRMTKFCAPLMREKRSGRIVNISSAGGRVTTYMGGWYHAAKYALEALSDSLRMELEPFNIKVILIEPGGVRSAFGKKAAEHLSSSAKGTVYEKDSETVSRVYAAVYREDSPLLTKAEKAADVIVKASLCRRPRARRLFGFGSRSLLILHTLLLQRAFDRLMRGMYTSKAAHRVIR